VLARFKPPLARLAQPRRLRLRRRSRLSVLELGSPRRASRPDSPRAGYLPRGMVTQDEIVEAGRTLAATASSPASVILFGSHARGEAGEHSDIDFLVVEDEVSDQIREYVRLRKAILPLDSAVDILVVSREQAVARRRVPGSVIRGAFREGKVIVER